MARWQKHCHFSLGRGVGSERIPVRLEWHNRAFATLASGLGCGVGLMWEFSRGQCLQIIVLRGITLVLQAAKNSYCTNVYRLERGTISGTRSARVSKSHQGMTLRASQSLSSAGRCESRLVKTVRLARDWLEPTGTHTLSLLWWGRLVKIVSGSPARQGHQNQDSIIIGHTLVTCCVRPAGNPLHSVELGRTDPFLSM